MKQTYTGAEVLSTVLDIIHSLQLHEYAHHYFPKKVSTPRYDLLRVAQVAVLDVVDLPKPPKTLSLESVFLTVR